MAESCATVPGNPAIAAFVVGLCSAIRAMLTLLTREFVLRCEVNRREILLLQHEETRPWTRKG